MQCRQMTAQIGGEEGVGPLWVGPSVEIPVWYWESATPSVNFLTLNMDGEAHKHPAVSFGIN